MALVEDLSSKFGPSADPAVWTQSLGSQSESLSDEGESVFGLTLVVRTDDVMYVFLL